jgi:peptidoglycan/LPS O-acetylase OafA/YrhL
VTMFNYLQFADVQEAMARATPAAATVIELMVMLAIAVFVAQPDRSVFTIGAPFVFAVAVLVFSRGCGLVTALLSSAPVRYVGTISYSIYLLHQPLQELFMLAALWCYATLGWTWLFAGDPVKTGLSLGATRIEGDAITAVMLIVLIAASTVTWRFIETPCRAWVRARVAATR